MDYGARWYHPGVGRFLGVDPLASDYAAWNPYHYVHNNPIFLTDPTGMSADTFRLPQTSDRFKVQFQLDLDKASEDPEIATMIDAIESSKTDVVISEAFSFIGGFQNLFWDGAGDDNHVKASKVWRDGFKIRLVYSQISGVDIDEVKSESFEILVHELQHVADLLRIETNATGEINLDKMPMEARAVETANKLRIMRNKPIRKSYTGTPIVNEKNVVLKSLQRKKNE